jgi:hypothetical protein
MKPSLEISDETFKQQFFADILINPENQVISFIDNEATMCNRAMKKIPEALIIHFLSQQSNSEIFEGISLTHWK